MAISGRRTAISLSERLEDVQKTPTGQIMPTSRAATLAEEVVATFPHSLADLWTFGLPRKVSVFRALRVPQPELKRWGAVRQKSLSVKISPVRVYSSQLGFQRYHARARRARKNSSALVEKPTVQLD